MVGHVHHNIITSKMITLQAVLLLSVGIASTGKSQILLRILLSSTVCSKHFMLGYFESHWLQVRRHMVRHRRAQF